MSFKFTYNKIAPYLLAGALGFSSGLFALYLTKPEEIKQEYVETKKEEPIKVQLKKYVKTKQEPIKQELTKQIPKKENLETKVKTKDYMPAIYAEKSFNYQVPRGLTLNNLSQHFYSLYTGEIVPSNRNIESYKRELKKLNQLKCNFLGPNQIINIKPPRNIRSYKNGNYPKNIKTFLTLSNILDKETFIVSSEYGFRVHPIFKSTKFHNGIDIISKPGSKVKSILDGKVVFVGRINGYGKVVSIETDGYELFYAHLSYINVKKGKIKKGQILGVMGSSGDATGPHTHFSVSKNKNKNKIDLPEENSIDPIKFIQKIYKIN